MENNLKIKTNRISKDIRKIKKRLFHYYGKGDYEKALNILMYFGEFMYQINQQYFDSDAENILKNIVSKLPYTINTDKKDSKCVLFFDGFGIERRGIELIYIKALIELEYKIIYVVPEKIVKNIFYTSQLINASGGVVLRMPEMKKLSEVEWLVNLINERKISKFFIYIHPNEIVPIIGAMLCEKKIERFQINLTDHAFWLGKNAFDYCIEFRDYGAYVSWKKRNIDKNKIIKLPYYPEINKKIAFKGFPFEKKDFQIMFSGGSLYKTFGANNLYYNLIKEILDEEKNLIFLYAGQGDTRELEKLKRFFPKRVYWMDERDDLYQIMKHSDIYFSTYPMVGGLMSQYAIAANRIPVTLLYDDCGKGLILHQKKAFFEFKDKNKLIDFLHKALHDSSFKNRYENELDGEIISIEDFVQGLDDVINKHRTQFEIDYAHVDTDHFQYTYMERLNLIQYFKLWCKKDYIFVAKYFPIRFFVGLLFRLTSKLERIIKRVK